MFDATHIIVFSWLTCLSGVCWWHIRRDQRKLEDMVARIDRRDEHLRNVLDRLDITLARFADHSDEME